VDVEGNIICLPLLPRGIWLEPTLNGISATCTEILSEFERIS
jgi:hypothetical protein